MGMYTCSCTFLNAGAHHWVCTARHPGGSVWIMDSRVLLQPITASTELQVAKIYNQQSVSSTLHVEIISVQQQEGLHDCGVFAIAYALEVCLNRRPEFANFNQPLMRQHLIKCLNEKHFEPFPKHESTATLPRPSHFVKHIKLYCLCNMPETFDDRMICCDVCNEWFHCSCVLPHDDPDPDIWKSSGCRR